MGYSKSIKTLENFYQYVQPLEKGLPYAWITEPGLADKVAYKIRECLYIARIYESRYPALAAAADKFIIEVVSSSKVQAAYSTRPTEATILSGAENVSPQSGGDPNVIAGRAVATSGEQTVFTIIDAWLRAAKNGNSNSTLHFPNAQLSDTQLQALWEWTKTRTPPLMIMVDDGSITLSPVDEEVVQYAWRPIETLPVANEELSDEPPKQVPIPPRPHW